MADRRFGRATVGPGRERLPRPTAPWRSVVQRPGPDGAEIEDLQTAFEAMRAPSARDPWHTPAPARGPASDRPATVATRFRTTPTPKCGKGSARCGRARGVGVRPAHAATAGHRAGDDAAGRAAQRRRAATLTRRRADRLRRRPPLHVVRAVGDRAAGRRRVRVALAGPPGTRPRWSIQQGETPLILAPICLRQPFTVDADLGGAEDEQRILASLRMVVAVNLLGLPAVAVSAGLDGAGLPLGVEVIGPRFREDLCLDAAAAIEQALGTPVRSTRAATGASRRSRVVRSPTLVVAKEARQLRKKGCAGGPARQARLEPGNAPARPVIASSARNRRANRLQETQRLADATLCKGTAMASSARWHHRPPGPGLPCSPCVHDRALRAAQVRAPQSDCPRRPARHHGSRMRTRGVAVIVMENEKCGDILGSSSTPYINRLADTYALTRQMSPRLAAPSLPQPPRPHRRLNVRSTATPTTAASRDVVSRRSADDEGTHLDRLHPDLPSRCFTTASARQLRQERPTHPVCYSTIHAGSRTPAATLCHPGKLTTTRAPGTCRRSAPSAPELCSATTCIDCDPCRGRPFPAFEQSQPFVAGLGPRGLLVLLIRRGIERQRLLQARVRGTRA